MSGAENCLHPHTPALPDTVLQLEIIHLVQYNIASRQALTFVPLPLCSSAEFANYGAHSCSCEHTHTEKTKP